MPDGVNCRLGHLNADSDDEFWINGYQKSLWRRLVIWILFGVTLGLLRLVFYWRPDWWTRSCGILCDLAVAESVIVIDAHRQTSVVPILIADSLNPKTTRKDMVPKEYAKFPDSSPSEFKYFNLGGAGVCGASFRYFKYRKLKYCWNKAESRFEKLVCLDNTITCTKLHQLGRPERTHGWKDVAELRPAYGPNLIMIRSKTIPELLFREVLNPFYVFQIFSIILWSTDSYWNYAICIGVISLLSVATDVYQIDQNQRQLRSMLHSSADVWVYRNGAKNDGENFAHPPELVQINSACLVPGDVVQIREAGSQLHCDAVLLEGNVIVNESMLTGESVPITKTPLPNNYEDGSSHSNKVVSHFSPQPLDYYNDKQHARHTLFCGTQVLQTRQLNDTEPVRALVIRTGFYSSKGALVRSIVYPKPIDYHFAKDLFRMMCLLVLIAVAGFIYAAVMMAHRDAPVIEVVQSSLNIVTIVVPPALPLAITVGIMIARGRLKRRKVFCIAPSVINTCGEVDTVVFDKTGTLTEDGLSLKTILRVQLGEQTDGATKGCFDLPDVFRSIFKKSSNEMDLITWAMASCHTLIYINGQLAGDPLDLILFRESGWMLEDTKMSDGIGGERNLNFFSVTKPVAITYVDTDESSSSFKPKKYQNVRISIVKPFPFVSSLQRMSVLTKIGRPAENGHSNLPCSDSSMLDMINDDLDFNYSKTGYKTTAVQSDFVVFSKGAPEMIASLCIPQSIPPDFSETLRSYTQNGFRVIALSYRKLSNVSSVSEATKLTRSFVECELVFLGLVVLENRLKPVSNTVIHKLRDAGIRVVMATGDNLETAVSVARECRILKNHSDCHQVCILGHYFNEEGKIKFEFTGCSPDCNDGLEMTEPMMSMGPNRGMLEYLIKSDVEPIQEEEGFAGAASRRNCLRAEANFQKQFSYKMLDDFINPPTSTNNLRFVDTAMASSSTESTKSIAVEGTKSFQLALTGETYKLVRENRPQLVGQLVTQAAVFARMSPDQKAQLIGDIQDLGRVVAMCGDGANDCGALKVAHVGISLTDSEACIAAPFTSQVQDISCVHEVIREGRAALVTSFGAFKFMINYSLCQFFAVSLMCWITTDFSSYEYLYIDLFLITTNAAVFGNTEAADTLAVRPPATRVFCLAQIASITLQFFIQAGFQIFIFVFVSYQPWFSPNRAPPGDYFSSYQNTVVFLISIFQYLTLVVVHSKAGPHRKTIFSNQLLLMMLVITAMVNALIMVWSPHFMIDLLDLQIPPNLLFRVFMLIICLFNFVISLMAEWVIVDWILGGSAGFPGLIDRKGVKYDRDVEAINKGSRISPAVSAGSTDTLNGFMKAFDMPSTRISS